MKTTGKLTFLFLGGAKRVAMAKLLAEAAAKEGVEAQFMAYELQKDCAIACMGPVIEGLRWNDPALMSHLEAVVREHRIDVVLPFVDAAVSVATRLAARCRDIFNPGANANLQEKLFDKIEAAKLFESHGIVIPKTYDGNPDEKKWIAKPRCGSASRGIIFLNSDEVAEFDNSDESYLIQECFLNREEISVDCYVSPNKSEEPVISPRKRLETMGGEAIRTVTISDEEVERTAKHILRSLKLCGAATIQFLRDLNSGKLMLMEINPRLGGGCTASVNAGADIPRCIVRDAIGKSFIQYKPKANVLVCRYLTDVIVSR